MNESNEQWKSGLKPPDKTMKIQRLWSVFLVSIIFIMGAGSTLILTTRLKDKTDTEPTIEPRTIVQKADKIFVSLKDETFMMILAGEIDAYYNSKGSKTDALVIWEVIDEASKLLPKYFPKGPFVLSDIITIASHESNFRKNAVAKHGERGIFQILNWETRLKAMGKEKEDAFDPRISTQMGVRTLYEKYTHHKSYKKAIIAYNGVIIGKNDQWNEKYWELFVKRKKLIRKLMDRAEKRYMKRVQRQVRAVKKGR